MPTSAHPWHPPFMPHAYPKIIPHISFSYITTFIVDFSVNDFSFKYTIPTTTTPYTVAPALPKITSTSSKHPSSTQRASYFKSPTFNTHTSHHTLTILKLTHTHPSRHIFFTFGIPFAHFWWDKPGPVPSVPRWARLTSISSYIASQGPIVLSGNVWAGVHTHWPPHCPLSGLSASPKDFATFSHSWLIEGT